MEAGAKPDIEGLDHSNTQSICCLKHTGSDNSSRALPNTPSKSSCVPRQQTHSMTDSQTTRHLFRSTIEHTKTGKGGRESVQNPKSNPIPRPQYKPIISIHTRQIADPINIRPERASKQAIKQARTSYITTRTHPFPAPLKPKPNPSESFAKGPLSSARKDQELNPKGEVIGT